MHLLPDLWKADHITKRLVAKISYFWGSERSCYQDSCKFSWFLTPPFPLYYSVDILQVFAYLCLIYVSVLLGRHHPKPPPLLSRSSRWRIWRNWSFSYRSYPLRGIDCVVRHFTDNHPDLISQLPFFLVILSVLPKVGNNHFWAVFENWVFTIHAWRWEKINKAVISLV